MVSLEERLHSYEPLWGQWRIGRRIYAGGQSAVFELERVRCDKLLQCVVKVIELSDVQEEGVDRCFERAVDEIERMEQLSDSSRVVTVYDDDIKERRREDGALVGYDILIRMERLTCLSEFIRDGRLFSEKEVARIGQELCIALGDAHRLGIVHRDIKPSNIFLTAGGGYKLGDFGAAGSFRGDRMLETIVGTAAYMAPEVARGDIYGPAADFYSLGVVLYQLLNDNFLPLTGERSTYSEREEAVRRRQRGVTPPPARRGGPALNAVVLKACSPEASDRFQDADEFLAALKEAAARDGLSEGGALSPSDPDEKRQGGPGPAAATGRQIGAEPVDSPTGRLRPFAAASLREKCFSLSIVAALCLLCLIAGTALPGLLQTGGNTPVNGSGTLYPSSGEENLEDGILNSRYEVVCQYMTWEDAKVYCESRGGHLATITSRKEEELVLGLLDENNVIAAWIGADNRNSSKGFKWVTEERFAYAAWGLNEPNNANGVEYYLMLVKSEAQGWVWNDSREDGLSLFPVGQVGFVCEWDEEQ